MIANQQEDGNNNHGDYGYKKELTTDVGGFPVILFANELGADDGSSGRHGKEDLQDQVVDGIYKGDSGNSGFSEGCHHEDICHTYQDDKQLLYN